MNNTLDFNYQSLLQDIQSVKNDLLEKFPNVPHTIRILIWDDETKSVECSHTDDDNTKHISKIHNGVLSHEKIEVTGRVMVLNDSGEEEYYKLVKI